MSQRFIDEYGELNIDKINSGRLIRCNENSASMISDDLNQNDKIKNKNNINLFDHFQVDQNINSKFYELSKLILNSFELAAKKVAPTWDLRDYVAVNPFIGFKDDHILNASKFFKKISGWGILPKREFYFKKYQSGEVGNFDLEAALKIYHSEFQNDSSKKIILEDLLNYIKCFDSEEELKNQEVEVKCLSDLYDQQYQCQTTQLFTNEISRWLSAYFDEGQSAWKISTDSIRLFNWWKDLVQYDQNFTFKQNFKSLVGSLPNDPYDSLIYLTRILVNNDPVLNQSLSPEIKKIALSQYYYRLFYTVLGWSSFIKKYEFEAHRSGKREKLNQIGGLVDLLVIRMVYDISLISEIEGTFFDLNKDLVITNDLGNEVHHRNQNQEYNYIWLNAIENAYRRSIEDKLKNQIAIKPESTEPEIQMVFCIDVRSEFIRRHLEMVSPNIQTIGFAGFFGLPISIKKLGHSESDQQCPVLLNSEYEINENCPISYKELISKKTKYIDSIYRKKNIQHSANSGFSFVETFGLSYIKKIIFSSLGYEKPDIDFSSLGLSENDKKLIHFDDDSLDLEKKVTLVFGILKNMGLTKKFSKYVFLIGHGSESSNNPFASSLECGACAGHNGLNNSKILANWLNNDQVRGGLEKKGIYIPDKTVFFSGWHHTTKDLLIIDRISEIDPSQKDELDNYQLIFDKASSLCREERGKYLSFCDHLKGNTLYQELDYRSKDWSEIRPEWGLARNASFIIGRRDLTKEIPLDGRSFLHDYDYREDSDLSRLELIMTAPMIVTNWINMQYYASTINPQKFGSGNKVLSNVVGGIGCIQGTEGDLLTGLSEQSVWYKGDYFHEPLRLQVFIEATMDSIKKVINKHELVKNLIANGWLRIISIDPLTRNFKMYLH